MQVSRLSARNTFLFLLLAILSVNNFITARGQDVRDTQDTARAEATPDDEPDDYDVKARVVRVSLMVGEVT